MRLLKINYIYIYILINVIISIIKPLNIYISKNERAKDEINRTQFFTSFITSAIFCCH